MLSAVTSIYFLHIRLSCLLNVLPNSPGTCKLKTPRCNEECISHRRHDSVHSGAGHNEVNVGFHLEWLTSDFQLVPLACGAEYCIIAHFYATFRIICAPATWWLRDGLQEQHAGWRKTWKMETNQSSWHRQWARLKRCRHLVFIAWADIPISVTMNTSCALLKLLLHVERRRLKKDRVWGTRRREISPNLFYL